jgi:CheY-like chemotaxis protein
VYGIVAESGGAVNLYSEEGLGTTIKLFLPVDGDPRDASKVLPAAPIPGAGETVLVVEDQDAVRDVTVRILRRNGYVVLEAATGAEAISVAADNEIDLLLTDVVMPKMSGRELAEHLRISRPDLPVLYMSGYAQGLFGPLRALDEGVALIPKPFNERALLQSVHDTLTSQKRL